jgi:glycosyltransferase A (GT-A) superfamily protein (DUF2064 family)
MLSEYLKQCLLIIQPEKVVGKDFFNDLHAVTAGLMVEKKVISTDSEVVELWKSKDYNSKHLNAEYDSALWDKVFKAAFDDGWRKVILLRSAPEGLTEKHLEEAFLSIRILELCLGPAKNGGIYLLGMPQYRPELLKNSILEKEPTWKVLQRTAGDEKAAMYKLPLL